MSKRFLVTYCGVLLALSAFASDVLLPAFLLMQNELATGIEQVQAAVPVFLIASGVGQAMLGVASDRFGRRLIILIGLGLLVAGAVVGMLATSIEVVLLGRALQGFGGACGMVVARAALRDTHSGDDLARALAIASALFTIGPLLAPLTGVALMQIGGWRGIFAGVAVVGACLFLVALLRLQETNTTPDLAALRPSQLAASLRRVLADRQSRYFLGVGAIMHCSLVSLVANSPRLYQSGFQIDGVSYAALFSLTTPGIAIGLLANGWLIQRLGALRVTRLAAAMTASTALVTALVAATPQLTAITFTLLVFLFSTSFLVVIANSTSLALAPHKEIAGFVASLGGCVAQLTGSLYAMLTFGVFDGAIGPWATGQAVVTGLVLLAVCSYRQQPKAQA
jgi:MFS transporter, DHA1 family, multidrug resistance protein